MVSLFPSLLSYQFFAITLLRVYAGLVLLYMAYEFARERGEIDRVNDWPIVGHIPEWLTMFGSFVLLVAGVLLVVGLYTQAAAIIGMLIGFKHVLFARRYPAVLPISAGTGAFLFIVCLALLAMGAGAFGFDLPV